MVSSRAPLQWLTGVVAVVCAVGAVGVTSFFAEAQLPQQPPVQRDPRTQPRPDLPATRISPIAVERISVQSTPNFATPEPFSLFAAQIATFNVTLNRASSQPHTVSLVTTSAPNNPAALAVPGSITVPANRRFVEFQGTAGNVTTNTTVGVKAFLGKNQADAKTAMIAVKPGSPPGGSVATGCTSPTLTLSGRPILIGDDTAVYTVTLSCPLAAATTAQVISNNGSILDGPPGNLVNVAANSTQFTFPARVGNPSKVTRVDLRVALPNVNPPRISNTLSVEVDPH